MTAKLDDLLTEILGLPEWERRQLLDRLQAAESRWDDLAKRAQDAGLLGNKALEGILRRALQSHDGGEDTAPNQQRKLVEKNGYLVAEALAGEKHITTEEIRDILDDMEW